MGDQESTLRATKTDDCKQNSSGRRPSTDPRSSLAIIAPTHHRDSIRLSGSSWARRVMAPRDPSEGESKTRKKRKKKKLVSFSEPSVFFSLSTSPHVLEMGADSIERSESALEVSARKDSSVNDFFLYRRGAR